MMTFIRKIFKKDLKKESGGEIILTKDTETNKDLRGEQCKKAKSVSLEGFEVCDVVQCEEDCECGDKE